MATESLKSILSDINTNKTVLPQFQRDFVWSPGAAIKLLNSLFNGYPVGSLLLMENNDNYDFRPIDGVSEKQKFPTGETILILDGQQRLTACWRAFFGTMDPSKKYSGRYYFDYGKFVIKCENTDDLDSSLEDFFQIIKPSKVNQSLNNTAMEIASGLFPLDILFGKPRGSNYADWLQKYNFMISKGDPKKFESLSEISSRFQGEYIEKVTGYQINYEKITRDTNADVICTVFETINTTGVKLTVFDLLVAKCYKSGIRLRDRLGEAIARFPNIAHFDPDGSVIASIQLPRIIGLMHNNQCKKGDLLRLGNDVITNYWERAVLALEKMLGLMKDNFGCAKIEFIPSMDIISPLAVICSDMRFNRSHHFELFRKLYWNLAFSLYLSGAPETKSAKIVREWRDNIFDNTGMQLELIKSLTFEFDNISEATKASAVYKSIISMIIANEARDFGAARKLLSNFDEDIEDHHVYPQKFLANFDIKGNIANGILNRTPIVGSTNRLVSASAPESYIFDQRIIGDKELEQNILDRHGLDKSILQKPFSREVFVEFCEDRRRRIHDLVEKFTGNEIFVQD